MNKILIRIILATAGAGSVYFFLARKDMPTVHGAFEGLGDQRALLTKILIATYAFLCLLSGSFLGVLYRNLSDKKSRGRKTVNLPSLMKEIFSSIDLYLSIVVSPIVFGILWQSIGDVSFAGMTLIALQNGFCSDVVVNQLKTQPATQSQ